MPLSHTNRRGQVYFLQSKATKTGKVGYSFTTKISGTPVNELPAGYEIWESPDNAQVHCRKIKPSRISPAEKQLLVDIVQKESAMPHFVVDVDGDALMVYTADIDEDINRVLAIDRFRMTLDVDRWRERMLADAQYQPMLKFTLTRGPDRAFQVHRWCFRGSVDGWLSLHVAGSLEEMAKRFTRHLGRESFLELM